MIRLRVEEDELYPFYVLRETDVDDDEPDLEVDEAVYESWCAAIQSFLAARFSIEQELHRQDLARRRRKALAKAYALAASRSEKEHLLESSGWQRVGISEWSKDGRTFRLHEAFDLCRKAFEANV